MPLKAGLQYPDEIRLLRAPSVLSSVYLRGWRFCRLARRPALHHPCSVTFFVLYLARISLVETCIGLS